MPSAFEARRARYTTPEQREVQQIVFPNEDEARQAAEKLAGGRPLSRLRSSAG